MYLVAVGLNHRTAPVEVREKLSISEGSLPRYLDGLTSEQIVRGCIILSTCNRTEVYASVLDADKGLVKIREYLTKHGRNEMSNSSGYLYTYAHYDVIDHLFRVAAGLDSMILGETQILGQVRTAYQLACEHGATERILNTMFQQAVSVGKRVRTETLIDQNAASISYAAVELTKKLFSGLQGRSILVVGAGKMSELTAKHLIANGVSSVFVSNRAFERATELARQFGGKAIRYDELFEYMAVIDIVISATAATHWIIKRIDMEKVMERRKGKPVFIIDIAVPRDVDPAVGEIEGVELYNIDDLQGVVDKNLEYRKKKAAKAEKIIEYEVAEFWKWLNTQFITPTIAALKKRGEDIKHKEVTRALNRLGKITEKEKKIISSLANSIVNQLLHDPVMQLKHYAITKQGHFYTEVLQNLFNLTVPKENQCPTSENQGSADDEVTGRPGG